MKSAVSRPRGRSVDAAPSGRPPKTKDRWSAKRRAAQRSAAPAAAPKDERRSRTDRPESDRARTSGARYERSGTDRTRADRTDRPRTDRPRTDRPRTDRTERPRTDRAERPRNDRRQDNRDHTARFESPSGREDRGRSGRDRDDRRTGDRPAAKRSTSSRFTDDRRRDDRRDDRRRDDRRDDRNRDERPFRAARSERTDRSDRTERVVQAPPVQHERYAAAVTTEVNASSFAALGLNDHMISALAALGAEAPFPIQAASIPDALNGSDLLGRGRTGSGKTIAFGAPMTQRIAASWQVDGKMRKPTYGRAPRGLILAPTRELAMQINRTMEPLARSQRLFTTTVVGGVPQQRQVQNLRRGVDIVIGTPGRLEDLIEQGRLDLSEVMITVLDEADHMCDLGFLEPVQRLLSQTQAGGQRLLYSATLDRAVESLVAEYLKDPSIHQVSGEDQASGTIDHRLLLVEQREKTQILRELAGAGQKTLIFARTKLYAETLAERLSESGLSVTSLHGDLTQAKRSKNLQLLTSGKVSVLVATDVAARGIHVDDIDLVVQADPPQDHKTYLHRSGRTGRAGRTGTVVTLATRQRRRAVESLLRDAEITTTPTNARPGDQVLRELAGA